MLGTGEPWSQQCRVCWVSAGDVGAADSQGVDAHARLGSLLVRVRGAFNCCSGGIRGAAWLLCWFDPRFFWGWDRTTLSIPSVWLSLPGILGSSVAPHLLQGVGKGPPGAACPPPPGTLPQGTKLEGIRTYGQILPARWPCRDPSARSQGRALPKHRQHPSGGP